MKGRLKFVLDKFGAALEKAATERDEAFLENVPEDRLDGTGLHVVELMAEADPSPKKLFTQWLVQTYIRDTEGFRLEDLGRAAEFLTIFQTHQRRFDPAKRDIGRLKTFTELWDLVEPFTKASEDEPVGRALRRAEREQARAESRILREGKDGVIIAVPLTEFAARWWGRGTRWCTASDRYSAFEHYNRKGPLFVIFLPDGRKTQLHIHSGQFMDETDRPAPIEFVRRNWTALRVLMRMAFREHPRFVRYFPPHAIHDDIVNRIFQLYPDAPALIPEELLTAELCDRRVEMTPFSFRHVPERLQTISGVRAFIKFERKQYENVLGAIRKDLLTDDVIDYTLEVLPRSIEHLPLDKQTPDRALMAVRGFASALRHIRPDLVTPSLLREAVAHFSGAFDLVPLDMQTEELCRISLQGGSDSPSTPQRIQDADEAKKRVPGYPFALRHLRPDLLSESLVDLSLALYPRSLELVPEGMRTLERCRKSIAFDGTVLRSVPACFRDEAMCRLALMSNGVGAIPGVPDHMREMDFVRIEVNRHINVKPPLPSRDKKLLLATLAVDGTRLAAVPRDLKTPLVCLTSVRSHRHALGFVPGHLRTIEMCMHAISQAPAAFDVHEDVPVELRPLLLPYGETEAWKRFDPDDLTWLPEENPAAFDPIESEIDGLISDCQATDAAVGSKRGTRRPLLTRIAQAFGLAGLAPARVGAEAG